MKAVYLRSQSSFKTPLRSDTLFGLLCWAIRQTSNEKRLEDLLRLFSQRKPPFLLSSAFPFTQKNGARIHYLPRPCWKPLSLQDVSQNTPVDLEVLASLKKFKKLRYLTKNTFLQIAEGKMSFLELFKSQPKDLEPLTRQVPHNTINHLSNSVLEEGGFFFTEEYSCPSGCGLYFLMEADPQLLPDLTAALFFLQHFGMGGDRSTGKGSFIIEIADFNLFSNLSTGNYQTALSLYYPLNEERQFYLQSPDSLWYRLAVRKGKVGGAFLQLEDFWKDTVVMFEEGSVFPYLEQHPLGENPIVKRHPFEVQAYGFAFPVRLNIKE